MDNEEIKAICWDQCNKFAGNFGRVELSKLLNSPFYIYEINGNKTAIYCIIQKELENWQHPEEIINQFISEYKSSYNIVRLEIKLGRDNSVLNVFPVLEYALSKSN